MNTTSWRYVNDITQMLINNERYWLTMTLLHLELWSKSHAISTFCIERNDGFAVLPKPSPLENTHDYSRFGLVHKLVVVTI